MVGWLQLPVYESVRFMLDAIVPSCMGVQDLLLVKLFPYLTTLALSASMCYIASKRHAPHPWACYGFGPPPVQETLSAK